SARDVPISLGRYPEYDATLHLRLERIGVHDRAAVDGADHAMYAHRSVRRHRDFGDLGAHRRLPFGDRDAASMTGRQRCAPSRLRGGELEGAKMARLRL